MYMCVLVYVFNIPAYYVTYLSNVATYATVFSVISIFLIGVVFIFLINRVLFSANNTGSHHRELSSWDASTEVTTAP